MTAEARPCFACNVASDLDAAPLTEQIWVTQGWRVAHALGTSLPGWMVLLPLRHVAATEDLTADEAEAMGGLIRRCSAALRAVTGCEKSYFMFFAEAEGFQHLHVHVVPRLPSFSSAEQGPRVFSMLGVLDHEAVSPGQMQAMAELLRDAFNDVA